MVTTTAKLISVLPVVLFVTVSLLLDHVLRYEKVMDRCKLQIWIWLLLTVVSVQSQHTNNDDDEEGDSHKVYSVWGHITLFFNLVKILAVSYERAIIIPSHHIILRMLQIFPLSCWVSMLVAVGTQLGTPSETATALSLWAFLCSFGLILLFRWYTHRTNKLGSDLQGTITTTRNTSGGICARFCGVGPQPTNRFAHWKPATDSADNWLDERRWYDWNKNDAVQWMSQQLLAKNNDASDIETNERVTKVLLEHGITGDAFEDLLDPSRLVTLHVPFGPASFLSHAIADLLHKHPKPGRRRSLDRTNCGSDRRNYLDLHDDEYNKPFGPQEDQDDSQHANNGVSNTIHRENMHPSHSQMDPTVQMTEEQHEKLNTIMKDRFGFELPKLKGSDFLEVRKGLAEQARSGKDAPSQPFESLGNGSVELSKQASRGASEVPQQNETHPNVPIVSTNGSLPDGILEGMPPEIREIAKRRPDLIETIWKQRRQRTLSGQQQPQTIGSRELREPITRSPFPETIDEESRTVQQGFAEDYDSQDENSEDEDEMTSLIHRETIEFPLRYRSIDKRSNHGIV